MSTAVELRHTFELGADVLDAARSMLVDVFDGDFDADDWDHALGGMHVLLREDGELVGHGAVVQRRVLHGGRALRCGYVEAIGVRLDRRRRGHGRTIMEAINRIVGGGFDLGALGASDDGAPLYRDFGWEPWSGPTAAFTPDGIRDTTPDTSGSLMVLRCAAKLDAAEALTCDWRDGELW